MGPTWGCILRENVAEYLLFITFRFSSTSISLKDTCEPQSLKLPVLEPRVTMALRRRFLKGEHKF